MRNKKLIKKYLNIISILFKFVPKFAMELGWHFFDSSESLLALLFRNIYLKKYCKNVKGILYIGKNTNFKNIENLSLGENISIHSYSYIDAFGTIEIGDNVSIANHCTLISSEHTWNDKNVPIKYNSIEKKSIKIESDVWIAAGCRILGGVTIGERTIVGAGAVVNKNMIGNSLYVGVPAKKVKDI